MYNFVYKWPHEREPGKLSPAPQHQLPNITFMKELEDNNALPFRVIGHSNNQEKQWRLPPYTIQKTYEHRCLQATSYHHSIQLNGILKTLTHELKCSCRNSSYVSYTSERVTGKAVTHQIHEV